METPNWSSKRLPQSKMSGNRYHGRGNNRSRGNHWRGYHRRHDQSYQRYPHYDNRNDWNSGTQRDNYNDYNDNQSNSNWNDYKQARGRYNDGYKGYNRHNSNYNNRSRSHSRGKNYWKRGRGTRGQGRGQARDREYGYGARGGYRGDRDRGYTHPQSESRSYFSGNNNKNIAKKHSYSKKVVITPMDEVLSEQVLYRLNYLEAIFTFVSFFDLITICALLSKHHFKIIFCNGENALGKCIDISSNLNGNTNKIFEMCFRCTFPNLVKYIVEKCNNNIDNNNDSDIKVKKIEISKNPISMYRIFNDWEYYLQLVSKSNIMCNYNFTSRLVVNMDDIKQHSVYTMITYNRNQADKQYNLLCVLATGDIEFIKYWFTQV